MTINERSAFAVGCKRIMGRNHFECKQFKQHLWLHGYAKQYLALFLLVYACKHSALVAVGNFLDGLDSNRTTSLQNEISLSIHSIEKQEEGKFSTQLTRNLTDEKTKESTYDKKMFSLFLKGFSNIRRLCNSFLTLL